MFNILKFVSKTYARLIFLKDKQQEIYSILFKQL